MKSNIIYDVHYAIICDDLSSLRDLIHAFISSHKTLNDTNWIKSQTPISLAIYRNNFCALKVLLEFNFDLNRKSKDDVGRIEPPLCTAVRLGNLEIVNLLLKSNLNLDVNQVDFFNQSSLWIAVKERRLDMVKILLNDPRLDLWSQSFQKLDSNPVYLAAKYLNMGRYEIMLHLIKSGFIETGLKVYEFEKTLSWIIKVKDEKIVKLLIKTGLKYEMLACIQPSCQQIWIRHILSLFPLSLVDQCRIVIRRYYLMTTRRTINLERLRHKFPSLPEYLVSFIASVDIV